MEEARESSNLPNYSRRLEVHKAGRTFCSWAPGVNWGVRKLLYHGSLNWQSSLPTPPTHSHFFFFFFACQILVQPQFKSIYTRLSYSRAQMLAHTVC